MGRRKKNSSGCLGIIVVLGVIGSVLSAAVSALPAIFVALLIVGAPVAVILIAWKVYESSYYNGDKFSETKGKIESHIADCNDLNLHIEQLKSTALVVNRTDYGDSEYSDASLWNMSRPELKNQTNSNNIHNCSRTVCDNARREPFKYVCKYFGISATESDLEKFETILNNFEAAEDGKKSLMAEREIILNSIEGEIPYLIKRFSKKTLVEKLGFEAVDLETIYFPKYVFKYTSSGGNASTQCTVTMDIPNLNRFVSYLSEKIKFKKSAAGQRSLMTSSLRKAIKERDGYTCKFCGASVEKEPNLLLEIDHIIPVSKGGLTSVDNLQTLCWRCNRRKGAKIQ